MSDLSSAAEAEYMERREACRVFLRAADALYRHWWPPDDLDAVERRRRGKRARDAFEALTSAARFNEPLYLTVVEDALIQATDGFSEAADSIDEGMDVARDLEARREHSGALLLRVLDDADETEWPEDVEYRGTEPGDVIAAQTARYRWYRLVFGDDFLEEPDLLRPYLQAAVDVMATFLDRVWWNTDDDEEILDRIVWPEGTYPEVLNGEPYPGF